MNTTPRKYAYLRGEYADGLAGIGERERTLELHEGLQLRGLEWAPLVVLQLRRIGAAALALALALDDRRHRGRVAEQLLWVAHAVVAHEQVEALRHTPQRLLPHEHVRHRIREFPTVLCTVQYSV